jgi:Methyltransferase domain
MSSKSAKKTPLPPPDIKPGQSIELLKALHILTVDGKMNQDSRRKLKQVYHLIQFIEPLVAKAVASRGAVNVVDHGAGKSYLGFILYDLVLKTLSAPYHIFGIETRGELIEKTRALAATLGFSQMTFLEIPAAQSAHHAALCVPVDIVTALHACDTATDDAIAFALAKKAQSIVLVPCCQAEIAAHLRSQKSTTKTAMSELWRHPIRTREFGAHVTNVLRSLQLEAHGYSVTVTELVGWEHSMKNELILAEYKNLPRTKARERLDAALEEFGLSAMRGRFAADFSATASIPAAQF